MEKYLITGFSGFVSGHLVDYLASLDKPMQIIGISRQAVASYEYKKLKISTWQLDLKDTALTNEMISAVKPNFIIHLASDSSVAYSWQKPVESFQNNTNIFLNLVESVRLANLRCRILSVGSSEEYGIVDPSAIPLSEEHKVNPISPYAVARVSQELLSNIYAQGYGLDIVMTRSFNHIGPRQKDSFVVSSFAKQIVALKRSGVEDLEVGNIHIVRDFLDVRDVARAYIDLLEKGRSGEVYNICSGEGHTLKAVLEKLMMLAKVDFGYNINSSLIRPSDNPIIIGDNKKIAQECDWRPKIGIEESLNDIIDYWTSKSE
jgi:GDP-4-dehydro-6-deoxy-D-mannose reductase